MNFFFWVFIFLCPPSRIHTAMMAIQPVPPPPIVRGPPLVPPGADNPPFNQKFAIEEGREE